MVFVNVKEMMDEVVRQTGIEAKLFPMLDGFSTPDYRVHWAHVRREWRVRPLLGNAVDRTGEVNSINLAGDDELVLECLVTILAAPLRKSQYRYAVQVKAPAGNWSQRMLETNDLESAKGMATHHVKNLCEEEARVIEQHEREVFKLESDYGQCQNCGKRWSPKVALENAHGCQLEEGANVKFAKTRCPKCGWCAVCDQVKA